VGAGASSGNAAPARPAAVAPAGSPPQAGQPGAAGEDALRVEFARFHRGQVFLKFYGYDDADSASALKGRYIAVARDQLVKLEEGAYFVFDLIGCAVRGLDGERLGILADVLETGSNDVYVVERPDGGDDLLVPALKSVVKSVCIDDKTIIVDKSLFAQP
jgi:16S rRNA processing protein RimM